MATNGKPTTERIHEFQDLPFAEPTKSQPLVKAEQIADEMAKNFAMMKKQQELKQQQLFADVAAFNNLNPTIEKVYGDPNHHLQQLTHLVLESGCEIAEHCIEIVIEDD